MYRKTHSDYNVGEKLRRGYQSEGYSTENTFGVPTPHDNNGKMVKKTLNWLHQTQQEKATKIVSKRVDDFRERTQPQLGSVHDP